MPTAQPLPLVMIVRHGETEWTISGRHTGRTDLPVTTRGEQEARELAARLDPARFATVLTSPLRRARETCELAGFGAAAQADDDLMEWNYGAYEGRRTVEIQAERPGWRLFADGCPGGETAEMVGVRADRVIARIRAAGGNAIVFAHRDLLRVLAVRWIDLPPAEGRRFYLSTASSATLGYDHNLNEPVIRVWNANSPPSAR